MAHVALRVTATYQIQISDKNTRHIPTYLLYKDTNITVKYEDTVTVYGAYYT